MSFFFTKTPVKNEIDALHTDERLFAAFYAQLLKRGVYLTPSPLGVIFISSSLTSEDVARTYDAISAAFASL